MICHHRGSNECPTTYDEEQCAISIEASKTMIICRKAFINRYSSRYQHEPCIRASDQWHKSSFTLLRPFTHLQSTESSKSTKQTRDPYTTTNKKAISSAHRPLHTMRQPGTSCQSTVATSSHLRTPHASASLTVPTDPPLRLLSFRHFAVVCLNARSVQTESFRARASVLGMTNRWVINPS